jgi:hypothetical protein
VYTDRQGALRINAGEKSGGWVRRRYVVEEHHIRPVAASKLIRYDPFQAYADAEEAKTAPSLYLDLANLEADNESAVEAFTSRWGLLGLFHHQFVQCRRLLWSRSGDVWVHQEFGSPRQDQDLLQFLLIGPRESECKSGLWGTNGDEYLPWSAFDFESEYAKRRMVLTGWLREHGLGQVMAQDEQGYVYPRPRNEFFGEYFPLLPQPDFLADDLGTLADEIATASESPPAAFRYRLEQGPGFSPSMLSHHGPSDELFAADCYPTMGSPELWEHLCEPLDQFRDAVDQFQLSFRSAVHIASEEGYPRSGVSQDDPFWEPRPGMLRARLHDSLTTELRRVTPELRPGPVLSSWDWGWSCPSLLSAAYVMLFLDVVVRQRKPRHCASVTCGKGFVTDRSDRLYCSPRCQNAQKQRNRRKRPEGQESRPIPAQKEEGP